MDTNVDIRYWDSNAFLGLLASEPDKIEECRAVLTEAEAGSILIVTSALTLAEVVKLRHHAPIDAADSEKIKQFFEKSYIVVRDINRYVAEMARELVWNNGVDPKDALHIATALQAHVPRLETFDEPLIGLSEQLGTPPLVIDRPKVRQASLFPGDPAAPEE